MVGVVQIWRFAAMAPNMEAHAVVSKRPVVTWQRVPVNDDMIDAESL